MKHFILFFALTACLIVSIGCNGNAERIGTDETKNTETSTAAITEDPLNDEVPILDFEGYVFRIIGHGDGNIALDLLTDVNEGDLVNDARKECFYKLNERFNISVENYVVSGAANAVRKSIVSGNTDFDAEALEVADNINLMSEKMIMPIENLQYIDLNKPYWDSSLNNELSVLNKSYLLIGDMFTRTAEWTNIIMYNRDMLIQYNISDLTQAVKNNEWTLDKLTEIGSLISTDIDGDGKFTQDDVYGLTASDASISNIFFSSGLRITEKDENDRPYLVKFSSDMVDVLNKTLTLKNENNICLIGGWEVIYNTFRDSRSLFYAEILAKMGGMRDVEADIGILPYPKYDDKQERYLTTTAESILALSVPAVSENPERTGAVLEAYASAASHLVRPAYYDVTLTYKNIRSESDVEMLDIILDSIVYDIGYFYKFGSVSTVFSAQLAKGSNTYASMYEEQYLKSETALNDWTALFDSAS